MEDAFLLGRQAIVDNKPAELAVLVDRHPGLANFVHRSRSMTLLHTACYYDRGLCVEALLRMGADPNLATEDGFTALHWAAMLGHPSCVVPLLSVVGRNGIDVNPESITGWTPLARAFSRLPSPDANSIDIVRTDRLQQCIGLLLDRRASLDSVVAKLGPFRVEWVGPRKLAIW